MIQPIGFLYFTSTSNKQIILDAAISRGLTAGSRMI
jgi:hypothetical protein